MVGDCFLLVFYCHLVSLFLGGGVILVALRLFQPPFFLLRFVFVLHYVVGVGRVGCTYVCV